MGAGVEVGMLRGAGDSLTYFLLDSQFRFFWKALGEADCFGPKKIKIIQRIP